ncbi:13454_t:CDS:2 [Racocetra fulgida]|uniref:13454_t:CDS:1 n=1 Tax=Racocetra fulgida TaxID=60492 RepID=A0A9N8ZYP1_9GLOM|nr:13454_t:CDS:2 [Racocetra fulgida]
MPEKMKLWVHDLIRIKAKWDDVKDAIVKIVNAKNNDKTKISQLRNIKQGEKEILRRYASRFEDLAEALKGKIRQYEQQNWSAKVFPRQHGEK